MYYSIITLYVPKTQEQFLFPSYNISFKITRFPEKNEDPAVPLVFINTPINRPEKKNCDNCNKVIKCNQA